MVRSRAVETTPPAAQAQEGFTSVKSIGARVPALAAAWTSGTLSRSMREVRCEVGELHWVKTEDHVYCRRHFVSGRMEHLDGRVTKHPVMAKEG